MARPRRVECRYCGGHVARVGELSTRGRCLGCAIERIEQAPTQLRERRGPFYVAWVTGLAQAVERELARL